MVETVFSVHNGRLKVSSLQLGVPLLRPTGSSTPQTDRATRCQSKILLIAAQLQQQVVQLQEQLFYISSNATQLHLA